MPESKNIAPFLHIVRFTMNYLQLLTNSLKLSNQAKPYFIKRTPFCSQEEFELTQFTANYFAIKSAFLYA